jgi:hypothetical protein
MTEDWQLLTSAGLPAGAVRPKPSGPLDFEGLAAALVRVVADLDRLEPSRREPLLAWLKGWSHHWPTQFQRTFGEAGKRCLRHLEEYPVDVNRYLKLRRIAIENLSNVL